MIKIRYQEITRFRVEVTDYHRREWKVSYQTKIWACTDLYVLLSEDCKGQLVGMQWIETCRTVASVVSENLFHMIAVNPIEG